MSSGGRPTTADGRGEVDSTLKILISTDNHLGFMERDPLRGSDSFTTFEEILRAARVEHRADCVVLGGDLFHDNKPSLGCLNRACGLFRKYVWGGNPVAIALRSNPAQNFPTHHQPLANWLDPNTNITLPVFAIHGNHDDPVGGTSSLDILANNGHLNYFGVTPSLEDIVVHPVMLQKGRTYVALYGLGNVRDDRLHRCFRLRKVKFVVPRQPPETPNARWFSILVLHQNRGMRDSKSKTGITEDMLAGFGLDLVIWGNEHDQRMVPEGTMHNYEIIQPGSSILTSITPMDCNPKQYGILEINGSTFRVTPFPLRSVRPTVRRSIVLCQDNPRGRTLDEVEAYLKNVIEEMLGEAEELILDIPQDVCDFNPSIKFPLMRLSVDFSDPDSAAFPQPNFIRFGQQYIGIVANPGDFLTELKPSDKNSAISKASMLRKGTLGRHAADGDVGGVVDPAGHAFNYASSILQFRSVDIATKVAEVFRTGVRPPCEVLSEMELTTAVHAFAEKNESNAIEDKILEMLSTARKKVWSKYGGSADILNKDLVVGALRRCKIERERQFLRQQMDIAADGDGDDGGSGGGGRKRRMKRMMEEQKRSAASEEKEEEAGMDRESDDEDSVTRADAKRRSRMFDDLDGVADAGRVGRGGGGNGTKHGDTEEEEVHGNADDLLRSHCADGGNLPVALFAHLRAAHGEEDATDGSDGYRLPPGGDEALAELPGDGLTRMTIDDLVARETGGGDDDGGSGAVGKKRARVVSAHTGGGGGDGDDDVVDVDGDDEGSNGFAALRAKPAQTRRRAEPRAPRGKAAAAAAAAGPAAPALNLVPANANSRGCNTTATAAGRGATGSAPAALQLLAKWGSQK